MMFPNPMPEMPQEIMDAMGADPGGFAEALGQGMEAFQGAMADGGDMGAAFQAMGDVMGPVMADMGVSPEAFDAAGDAFGAAVGGGMHMGPADAGGPEMGAMMQDACTMMMPEGTEMPAPVMDAMADMGQGFADAGCNCHDMAAEMMPPPGDPGFPMPCNAEGECIVPPGDPAACPADCCQPPPMDGACADMGGPMMPPEGGHDHAPMPPDAQMPPPMETGDVAMAPHPGPEGMGPGPEGMGPGPEGMGPGPEGMGPGPEGMGPGPEGMGPGPEGPPPGMEGGPEGPPPGMDALDSALGGDPAGGDMPPPPPADDPMGAALDGAAAASDAGAAGGQQGPGPDTMADMPDPGAESDMPKPEEDDQGGGAAG